MKGLYRKNGLSRFRFRRIWFSRIAICITTFILCVIGTSINAQEAQSSATASDLQSFRKAVADAYKNYETVVDMSNYNFNMSRDKQAIDEVITDVSNNSPYIFYNAQKYGISYTNEKIVKINLSYLSEYLNSDGSVNIESIKAVRRKINTAVKKAVKCVKGNMSELEKAMVLHDYIVMNTAYNDSQNKSSRLNICGVLLENQANCQGYTIAYKALLNKIGIKSKCVTSIKLKHAWNLVRIDNKWYNVDVTWDDQLINNQDSYGIVSHKYFMGSTSYFKSNGHYGFEANEASGTKYDNMYWKDIESAFYYSKGKWLYLWDKGIVQRNSLTGGREKLLYKTKNSWRTDTKIYKANASSFVKFNDNKYYFIDGNNIYMYTKSANKADVIWQTYNNYDESYYLKQIMYSEGTIYYRVLKLNGRNFLSGSFNVNSNGMAA